MKYLYPYNEGLWDKLKETGKKVLQFVSGTKEDPLYPEDRKIVPVISFLENGNKKISVDDGSLKLLNKYDIEVFGTPKIEKNSDKFRYYFFHNGLIVGEAIETAPRQIYLLIFDYDGETTDSTPFSLVSQTSRPKERDGRKSGMVFNRTTGEWVKADQIIRESFGTNDILKLKTQIKTHKFPKKKPTSFGIMTDKGGGIKYWNNLDACIRQFVVAYWKEHTIHGKNRG